MTLRPIEILLVEDSPGDVWLTRETLLEGKVPKNIHVVSNGEQALDFLFQRGRYTTAVRPDLVLLDLNLPRRDGLEVLREIKEDPVLRAITVVVLTTSQAISDVNTAYDLNANCYIVKPVDLELFTQAIRGIEDFWMSMALLPTTLPPAGEAEPQADSESTGGSAEMNGPGGASTPARTVRRVPIAERVRYPGQNADDSRGPAGSRTERPRAKRRASGSGGS